MSETTDSTPPMLYEAGSDTYKKVSSAGSVFHLTLLSKRTEMDRYDWAGKMFITPGPDGQLPSKDEVWTVASAANDRILETIVMTRVTGL